MKNYYVYILSSKNKVLYIAMTNVLAKRIFEHKNRLIEGVTKNYNVDKLVYFESQPDLQSAIKRESNLRIGTDSGRLI